MRILGIDPGSRITGIGIIENETLIHAENLKLGDGPMPERLGRIFESIASLIESHRPEVAAVETIFLNRNPQVTIKLGQARGAAVCAAVQAGLTVHEYAPRAVKQALVGRGGAAKAQVQHMTRLLLSLKEDVGEDASDALAVALCHYHTTQTNQRLPEGVRLR
jgi:crossover junction endodeoxyribonuclease RuvC